MMTHAFYLSLDFVEILFPIIMNATSTIKELEFFALLFRYNCTFEKNEKTIYIMRQLANDVTCIARKLHLQGHPSQKMGAFVYQDDSIEVVQHCQVSSAFTFLSLFCSKITSHFVLSRPQKKCGGKIPNFLPGGKEADKF